MVSTPHEHRGANALPICWPLRSGLLAATLSLAVSAVAQTQAPRIPTPLPTHPGNIFVTGQEVRVRIPPELTGRALNWGLENLDGHVLAQRELGPDSNELNLGKRPVGYYRIRFFAENREEAGWTSAAVLARLEAPVPEGSPICLDAAAAWFAQDDAENQRIHANLAALAGVRWVRDRLRWREIEPAPGRFASETTYDSSAQIQHDAGLEVLQVFHDTPPWAREAGAPGGEFAADLRHVYRLAKAMAERFHGRIQAWEPWNEGNVRTFGGHTMDQMCSWQKAAWLGFKAGDSELTVGWNASAAVPTDQQTMGILLNETWPYFDTYNIHTYDWPHSYEGLWAPAREASCGRPLWITEADRGLKHENVPPYYDLTPRGERLKAELMAQSYVQSLFAGAARHFHFILGHYCEPNGVQFGLLREDFTPRPAYVALAAVGRFLAGARCLGRWRPGADTQVYAFRAQPDGRDRDVLVVWAEKDVDWPQRGKTKAPWPLTDSSGVESLHDFLGRDLGTSLPKTIGSAPLFVVLRPGAASQLPLVAPEVTPRREGKTSPIVLQILASRPDRFRVEDKPWSESYAYGFRKGAALDLTLAAYNFTEDRAVGKIEVERAPQGWRLSNTEWRTELDAMDRRVLSLSFTAETGLGAEPAEDGWIVLRGDFGSAGRPVVAFRMVAK